MSRMRRERRERKEKRTLKKCVCRGFWDLDVILMLSLVGVVCWMSLWYGFSFSPFGDI